jgi:succinyl-diaminopimelate desuccinylase
MATALRIRAAFPDIETEDRWYTSCTIGMIAGGQAVNQVPDLATCTLDLRRTEQTERDALVAQVTALAEGCTVEVMEEGPVSFTDPANPYVQQYAAAVRREIGRDVVFTKSHGAHDGRYLTVKGIPAIVSRPTSGGQHGPDEWVDLKSLAEFHRCYRSFLAGVLGA